ncbi:MAG: hypothetical protein O3C40_16795 [Planctomycetota bacterium]|nr:hypothetical protein [Planctomycetota bacterium]
MLALDLILRWMHILGAIMLVGSTIFMRTAYVPAKELSDFEPKPEFAEWLRKAWSRMVLLSSAQLLISGLVAFGLLMSRYNISEKPIPASTYHMIFGIKFLLAFVVFFLAAALSGRSGLAKKLRQREKFWLTLNMVLAITVVCLAGVMRLADRSEKSTSSLPQPAASVANVEDAASTTDQR